MARKAKAVKAGTKKDKPAVQVKHVSVKTVSAQQDKADRQERHAQVNSAVSRHAKDEHKNSSIVFTDGTEPLSTADSPAEEKCDIADASTNEHAETAEENGGDKGSETALTEDNAADSTSPADFTPEKTQGPVECLSYFDDPNISEAAQIEESGTEKQTVTRAQQRAERRNRRKEERKSRDRHANAVLEEHKAKVRAQLQEAEMDSHRRDKEKKKEERRIAKQEEIREKKDKLRESVAAASSVGRELAKAGSEKLSETTENVTRIAKAGKEKLMTDKKVEPDADRSLQRWKDISKPRRVVMALSVLLMLYSLFPLTIGLFLVGMIPVMCIAVFCFMVAWMWNKIETQEKWYINLLYKLAALTILCGIVVMAFLAGKMVGASLQTPPRDSDEVTVVVLGCLIKGDRPSLMLKDRLDTAAEYLKKHPGAYCVVTGGQGEDEDYPEAVVMKKYLAEKGISDRRILAETTSTSTKENIENAAVLINGCNLFDKVVIVSDRFHQYRARCLAEDTGFEYIYALNTETRWYLIMPYWFREMACIVRDWILSSD